LRYIIIKNRHVIALHKKLLTIEAQKILDSRRACFLGTNVKNGGLAHRSDQG